VPVSPRSLLPLTTLLLVACGGGGGATTTTPSNATQADGAAPWPWEARLVQGASFTLVDDDDTTVTMTVAAVDASAGRRAYTLAWDAGNSQGPTSLVVTGAAVQIGESKMDPARADASTSYRDGDVYCFAEDFSNPDGCEDVCDAELCFTAEAGLVEANGLYAPSLGIFTRR
jgi:hypothetical protein